MKPSNHDAVFGPDEAIPAPPAATPRVTYAEVVKHLQDMDPRALTNDEAGDVIKLLDYMHDHCLKLFDKQMKHEDALNARAAKLNQREADLAIKQLAVDAVLRMNPPIDEPKRRYFWSK